MNSNSNQNSKPSKRWRDLQPGWAVCFLLIWIAALGACFGLVSAHSFSLSVVIGFPILFGVWARYKNKPFMLSYLKHEVRTPLNTLLGLLDEIHRDSKKKIPLQLQKQLAILRRSAKRLHFLLEDVMNAEDIEAGQFEIKEAPWGIASLISDLDSVFTRVCREKGVRYESSIQKGIPAQITGDERRIVQVLWNLLHNACKFTNEGVVSLRVSSRTFKGVPKLLFEVGDTGIGIDQENQTRIFEKFVSLDSHRASKGSRDPGSGLGLWISGKIAQALGASITVESTLGKGSRFYFEIDLKESQGLLSHGKFKKVLFVEDSVDNQSLIKLYLKKNSALSVEFAETLAQARKKITENIFEAIFLDFKLPDGDGSQFLTQIKKDFPKLRSKWIAMSANIESFDGFDGVLQKPMHRDDLLKFFAHPPVRRKSKAA